MLTASTILKKDIKYPGAPAGMSMETHDTLTRDNLRVAPHNTRATLRLKLRVAVRGYLNSIKDERLQRAIIKSPAVKIGLLVSASLKNLLTRRQNLIVRILHSNKENQTLVITQGENRLNILVIKEQVL